MKIIVRCCGERTEKKCIELAKKQGTVHVVKAYPFGETLRQSYELAISLKQKWVPMVDGDVLLFPGTLQAGIDLLNNQKKQIFCFDGSTKDKIFARKRRAGIHIYKTVLLRRAIQFIDDNSLKPETRVRQELQKLGYLTFTNRLVFGQHDYDQYYRDLWRKSVCQSQKLARMIQRTKIIRKWQKLSLGDNDYKVILAANRHGMTKRCKIVIDSRIGYEFREGLKRLRLKEKGKMR